MKCEHQTHNTDCEFIGNRVDHFAEVRDLIELPGENAVEIISCNCQKCQSCSNESPLRNFGSNERRNWKNENDPKKTEKIRQSPNLPGHCDVSCLESK